MKKRREPRPSIMTTPRTVAMIEPTGRSVSGEKYANKIALLNIFSALFYENRVMRVILRARETSDWKPVAGERVRVDGDKSCPGHGFAGSLTVAKTERRRGEPRIAPGISADHAAE
jgi:hypothetical protein